MPTVHARRTPKAAIKYVVRRLGAFPRLIRDSTSGVTGARNRYPRRGSVSINTGLSASSPRLSRSLRTATLRLCSKSTKVSDGHISDRSSSRVTRSPGLCSRMASTWNGCFWSLIFTPFRYSSAACRSAWKHPKETIRPLCRVSIEFTARGVSCDSETRGNVKCAPVSQIESENRIRSCAVHWQSGFCRHPGNLHT